MRAKAIVLAALAASLLLVGAAGMVSAQPNETDGDAGPPSDLPGPVPDFVEDILGSINDFLSGTVTDLGDAVSGIASGR